MLGRASAVAVVLLAGCSVTLEGNGEGPSGAPPAQPEPGPDAALPLRDASLAITADGEAESGCDIDGRYAIRVAFDVKWNGTTYAGFVPIISPGNGELSFIVLADISRAAGKSQAVAQACAAQVPDFVSSLPQESYSAQFPEVMWNSSSMPRFQLVTHYACFEPGCGFKTDPIFAQLGSQLAAPSAVWPMRAAGGGWPDHDNDSKPGITLKMRGPDQTNAQGQAYAYPPVTPLLVRRVSELQLGLRIGVTLSGELDGCDALEGNAPMGSIDTRAIDCVAEGNPRACSDDELTFLDDNLPVWTVRGGSFRGIRVAQTADCAAARAAFP